MTSDFKNDELSFFSTALVINQRKKNFVWIVFAQTFHNYSSINLKNADRDYILDCVRNNPLLKARLEYYWGRDLIPEQEYDWITDSPRQSFFIQNTILNNQIPFYFTDFPDTQNYPKDPFPNKPVKGLGIPHELTGRDLSIALIDFWVSCSYFDYFGRVNLAKQIRTMWDNHTQFDKKFDWFNKGDPEARRREFWEWLRKKEPQHAFNLPSFQNHDELLSFFDRFNWNHLHQSDLMRRFKNNWNQQQLRARSKGKKQCNFVLSDKTVSKLEKLAAEHHLTRTEIVELIIDAEAKHQTYIRERLSRKQQLLGSLGSSE